MNNKLGCSDRPVLTFMRVRRWIVGALLVALSLAWLMLGYVALAQEGEGPVLLSPGLTVTRGAVDDTYDGLSEDVPVSLNVLLNDDLYHPMGDYQLISCTVPSPYGTAEVVGDRVLFTPDNCAASYTSTFYYLLVPGYPEESWGKVTVVVEADDDPLLLQDKDVLLFEGQLESGLASDMLDPAEADESLVYAFSAESNYWLTWDSDGAYQYRARQHHMPYTDTYTVMVTDTVGLTDTALLHFVVSAENNHLYDWTYHYELDEDGGVHHGIPQITLESYEPLTATIVQEPVYGTAGFDTASSPAWTYIPENRSTGYTATIVYALTDTLPSSVEVTVHLTVTADNDLPYVDGYPHLPDVMPYQPYSVTVTVRDDDVDQTASVDVVTKPDWLGLQSEISGTATFAGSPGPRDTGTATFAVRGYDGQEYSDTFTRTFEVLPLHDVAYVDGSEGSDNMYHGGDPRWMAFRTINYAIDRIAYGGTVLVAPGTYTEGLTLSKPVTLAQSYEGGDGGQRVMIDGSTSQYDIGIIIHDSDVSITGFDIINAERGVLVQPGAENVSLSWCNLVDDWGYGIAAPYATHFADARHNWWGAADGPSGVGPGSGTSVTENVLFEPWLSSRLLGRRQATLDAQETLDAEEIAGLTATISTTAPVTLTLAQYEDNPQGSFLYEGDVFWDVQLLDDAPVQELVVRFHLTEEDSADMNMGLSQILFWDAEADPPAWVPCSHQQAYRYAYYSPWEGIDVTFGPDTRPSLSQLTGTEFGFLAMPYLWPEGLSMSRTGGPERYAPGWNLRFEMVISNTADIPLHNVIITDFVPYRAHNWYEITGDLGQPEITPMSTWEDHVYRIDELQPGEVLRQQWIYHTPTTSERGFMYEAIGTSYEGDWRIVGMTLRCDHSLSEPTPSPTPAFGAYLPAVLKE